jgi:hypothetical protein
MFTRGSLFYVCFLDANYGYLSWQFVNSMNYKKTCPFQPRPSRLVGGKMHKQINLVGTRKVPMVYPWKVPPRLPTKLICLCIFWVRVDGLVARPVEMDKLSSRAIVCEREMVTL